jgi:hypothetical protein
MGKIFRYFANILSNKYLKSLAFKSLIILFIDREIYMKFYEIEIRRLFKMKPDEELYPTISSCLISIGHKIKKLKMIKELYRTTSSLI